jgi:hypothetical protein
MPSVQSSLLLLIEAVSELVQHGTVLVIGD